MNIPVVSFADAPQKLHEGSLLIAFLDGSYAIIGDARNENTMESLRQIKSRGPEKGFTILIDSDARLNRYVKEIPPLAWDIIDSSDDPIILVLPEGQNLAANALASDRSVAIRMVKTAEARKLVQITNGPVACTALPDTSGHPASNIDLVSPGILEKVDYLLTLPTVKIPGSPKKIPIIALGMAGEIRIIRQ